LQNRLGLVFFVRPVVVERVVRSLALLELEDVAIVEMYNKLASEANFLYVS